MQLIEVRCCCDPGRLLGWMRVPLALDLCEGQRVRFRAAGQAHATGSVLRGDLEVHVTASEVIELEVGVLFADGGEFLALKSNDVPIELLMRVPGFLPVSSIWPEGSRAGLPDA